MRISSKCKPVVGSSKMYNVRPVSFFDNSAANLIRWASPPESVVEGCPSVMYPKPTSFSVLSLEAMEGMFSKNSTAWAMLMFSTSLMFFPR